jgi:transcription antitermination factor NusA-like protein
MKTIDMQLMRYINLFGRISRVSTTDCFVYNNTIYFAVPKKFVMIAVGRNGENVKRISETLRRKIRIVAMPSAQEIDDSKIESLKRFLTDVVAPVKFSSIELKDDVVVLSGDRESKAILIGRDRCREKELSEVLEKMFGVKGLKIA